mmetsp:Transcript_50131/g.144441  ORF Transcript_50131/g.144441 Transcript_50131/m.144441 type:complete len:524 (-) Transcript_50131:46-1617(-)
MEGREQHCLHLYGCAVLFGRQRDASALLQSVSWSRGCQLVGDPVPTLLGVHRRHVPFGCLVLRGLRPGSELRPRGVDDRGCQPPQLRGSGAEPPSNRARLFERRLQRDEEHHGGRVRLGGRRREEACGVRSSLAQERCLEHAPGAHGRLRRDRGGRELAADRLQEHPRSGLLAGAHRCGGSALHLPGEPLHPRDDQGRVHRQGLQEQKGHRPCARDGERGRGGHIGAGHLVLADSGRAVRDFRAVAERRGHRRAVAFRPRVDAHRPNLPRRQPLRVLFDRAHGSADVRLRWRGRRGRGGRRRGAHAGQHLGRVRPRLRHGLRLVYVLWQPLGMDHAQAVRDECVIRERADLARPRRLFRQFRCRLRSGQDRRQLPEHDGWQGHRPHDRFRRRRRLRPRRLQLGAQLRWSCAVGGAPFSKPSSLRGIHPWDRRVLGDLTALAQIHLEACDATRRLEESQGQDEPGEGVDVPVRAAPPTVPPAVLAAAIRDGAAQLQLVLLHMSIIVMPGAFPPPHSRPCQDLIT